MSDSSSMKVLVQEVRETETFGDNGFRVRKLIGESQGQYPSPFEFQFINDAVDKLDNINVNDEIVVHYNVRCRKVEKPGKEDMYFTSLNGWKIDS